ncbi:tail fiber protein [Vibrio phage River4]|uniref:Tail fiber protein n=1 Tax=Vibrio phage River4 TaxID=2736288 RepID=A0A6M9Z0V2_9CAUD|nr:tail fiber protein [Vibrio phage River4]QKN84701.1 tail fiber protein [Vibrio phage River4]
MRVENIQADNIIVERGVRVYSPNNKPSASDIGALPSNGKAADAIKSDTVSGTNLGKTDTPYITIPNAAWYADAPIGKSQMVKSDSYRLPITASGYVFKIGARDVSGGSSWIFSTDYAGVATRVFFGTCETSSHDPKWHEVYSPNHKPTAADVGAHPTSWKPTWNDVQSKPAQATRWPSWNEVTGKPSTIPPSSHTHPWSQITGEPVYTQRWPNWNEVSGKPGNLLTQTTADTRYLGKNSKASSATNSDKLGNVSSAGYQRVESGSIPHPLGGKFTTTTSNLTGPIKIVLPAATAFKASMLGFTVNVYNYSTNTAFQLRISGYDYTNKSWINCSAQMISGARDVQVRFGNNGSRACIYVGSNSEQWSYPQVTISDFLGGYSGGTSSNWRTGWEIYVGGQTAENVSYDTVAYAPYTAGKKPSAGDVGAYTKGEADGRYLGKNNSAASIRSHGKVTALSGSTVPPSGVRLIEAYNNGYPDTYGNVLQVRGNGSGEIFLGWSGNSGGHAPMYIRSKRDVSGAPWSGWARVYTTAQKPTLAELGAQATLSPENRRKITYGTGNPSGGSSGDIYIQYK